VPITSTNLASVEDEISTSTRFPSLGCYFTIGARLKIDFLDDLYGWRFGFGEVDRPAA